MKINGVAETGWKHFFEQNFHLRSGWRRTFWLTIKHTSPKMEMVSLGSWQGSLEANVEWAASHEKAQHRDPSLMDLPSLLPHGLLGVIQFSLVLVLPLPLENSLPESFLE